RMTPLAKAERGNSRSFGLATGGGEAARSNSCVFFVLGATIDGAVLSEPLREGAELLIDRVVAVGALRERGLFEAEDVEPLLFDFSHQLGALRRDVFEPLAIEL